MKKYQSLETVQKIMLAIAIITIIIFPFYWKTIPEIAEEGQIRIQQKRDERQQAYEESQALIAQHSIEAGYNIEELQAIVTISEFIQHNNTIMLVIKDWERIESFNFDVNSNPTDETILKINDLLFEQKESGKIKDFTIDKQYVGRRLQQISIIIHLDKS